MSDWVAGTTDHYADLPGLRMHYVEAGAPDGFPVVLLHGFPEFWYSWRYQIPVLAEAGYRVIVPDQRGYNLTEKQGPYTLRTVTSDFVNLLDALEIAECDVVGHDWGGPPAWAAAAWHPTRIRKLASLNGPHPNAFLDALRHHPKQLFRSWYIYFFQLPMVPEALIQAGDYAIVDKVFSELPEERMSMRDLERYKDALAQRGALSAMIGWYRALVKTFLTEDTFKEPIVVGCPACVIWGEKDVALEKGVNDTLHKYARDVKIHFIPDASHWVQMHKPDEVNHILLKFLADDPLARPEGEDHGGT